MNVLVKGLGWLMLLAGAGLLLAAALSDADSRADADARLGAFAFAVVGAALFFGGRALARRKSSSQPAEASPRAEPAGNASAQFTPAHTHGLAAAPPAALHDANAEVSSLARALVDAPGPDAAWRVRDGAPEGVDLVAEWNLVDARWRDLALQRGMERTFKTLLKLDRASRSVRAVDEELEVRWEAGVPVCSPLSAGAGGSASFFRGQKVERGFDVEYRTEDVMRSLLGLLRFKWEPPKPVVQYAFSTDEVKGPLRQAVEASGWRWEPVAFGRL